MIKRKGEGICSTELVKCTVDKEDIKRSSQANIYDHSSPSVVVSTPASCLPV
jgi:hypothetical protein